MKKAMSLLILGLSLSMVGPLGAAEKAGVNMPDQVEVAGKQLVLNGLGVREATVFKVDVYVAGLYLEAKNSNAQAILQSPGPKRLVLRLVRDVDKDDMTKALTEGLERNAANAGALKDKLQTINSWMTDCKKGDMLVFTYVPGQGIQVVIKGATKGTVPGEDFARGFLSIWLGPKPPNAGLKTGLLGG